MAPTTHSASGMSNTPRALHTVTVVGDPAHEPVHAGAQRLDHAQPPGRREGRDHRLAHRAVRDDDVDRRQVETRVICGPGPQVDTGRHLAQVLQIVGIGGDTDRERAARRRRSIGHGPNDVPSTTAVSRHLRPGRARQKRPGVSRGADGAGLFGCDRRRSGAGVAAGYLAR